MFIKSAYTQKITNMLALWSTGFSKKLGLCSLRCSPVNQKSFLFFNSVNMGKKSKKKASRSPVRKSVNERLTAIRKQTQENLKLSLVQDNVTSLLKRFPEPSKTLMDFFGNLAVKKENRKYILIPQFETVNDLVKCTLKLKYPKVIDIDSFGNSKESALKCCSLEALQFLNENGCITHENLIETLDQNNLTYDYFVDATAKYDKNYKLKTCKNTQENENYNLAGRLLKTGGFLDINKNDVTTKNLNNHRNFSTSSKADIRSQVLEKPKHKISEGKQLKLSQTPKSVIHNYYGAASNHFDRDFKISPHYVQSDNQWTCTYQLKWPEDKSFVGTARTRKESGTKACLEIIKYLKSLKLINSHGQPIFKEENAARKQRVKIISLKDTTIEKLNEINDIYRNDLLTSLMDSMDSFSDASIKDTEGLFSNQRRIRKFQSLEFYIAKEKTLLPISSVKDDLVNIIRKNQVVIIKGEPGCGKSTRVPQYILEDWVKHDSDDGKLCRIVVTQPRRIAAISLAERVSYERDENVGRTVGYQVRLQNSFCPNAGRILYCTTGILLRKMQSDPTLGDCSHIILDEAHERDVNTDLLMNLLRCALKTNKDLKVVIMSATIDTGIFQKYFSDAARFHVSGFTYPVKQHFIDQLTSTNFSKTLEMCEGKNPNVIYEDVVKTVEYIHKQKGEGAILCFLPGWEDIKSVADMLAVFPNMQVLCLHSRLSMKEQKLIFSKPPRGTRKVILSTNIAETSVTIDDIAYVIDTGIQKETKFDSKKGVTCLDNSWISQANVRQRKGRAGRCQPGECFHLYPKQKSKEFDEFPVPEILRTSLTKIVLDSKVYSNNMNAADFLSQLITPPSDGAIQLAVKELTELELLDVNENLTSLGSALANFQLEPKLAKTMVNAVVFKCVTPIIDIVTLFSEEKELFSGVLYSKEQVRKIKKEFSKISDHLALMRMFEKWLEYIETNKEYQAERFCTEKNLVKSKLRTLQQLRDIHFGYLQKYIKDVLPISDDFSDNDELVKGVLLSGVGTLIERSEMLNSKKKNKYVLLTRNNHKATITSESVNGDVSSYLSDYLIYINEMVSNLRRSSIIRETSLLSLLTVLLFKNNKIILEDLPPESYSADINSNDQVLLTLKNTKYKYIIDRCQAETIKNSKEVLQAMLQYYIFQLTSGGEHNPSVNKEWNRILRLLNKTLEEVRV